MTETKQELTREINIEEIMREIRQEIKDRGYQDDILSFTEVAAIEEDTSIPFDYDGFALRLSLLWQGYELQPNQPIRSRPGPIGKVIIFCKKLIRKCVRFYVEPLAVAQNEQNRLVVECFEIMRNFTNEKSALNDKVEDLKASLNIDYLKKVDLLSDSYSSLRQENRSLQGQLADEQAKREQLEQEFSLARKELEILQLEQKRILLLLDQQKGEVAQ